MDFATPRRRRPGESIVPMINVVFLLLIFFMITAEVASPPPFDLTPPETASGDPAERTDTLYIDAQGELAFNEARGPAVLDALAARATPEGSLFITADANLKAQRLAKLLPELAARGIVNVQLIGGQR